MSTQLAVFSNQSISTLTFNEIFNISPQLELKKALFVKLSQDELTIEQQENLFSINAKKTRSTEDTTRTLETELVIFSTLTVNTLVDLCAHCHISIESLNAINHRNNQTSLRFAIETENLLTTNQLLANYCQQHQIEAAILKNAPKLATPGLLVMDMDSTTIQIECIDEIAKLAGVGEQVAEVTELAMQGKLDFSQSLRQRVATLTNAPESILEQVAQNLPLMPGLETLVRELKHHGWKVAIASGGFTYFADLLKDQLGLDAAYANTLAITDGKLTGEVVGEIVDANVKATSLTKLAKQFNIAENQTVAMGDGANDLIMMDAAYLGIAYHAKPLVKEKADTNICHQGLDIMLHWLA